jgi:hypothetical protein
VVDYAGQSGQANYTVHQGDSWIGLMMSEQVSIEIEIHCKNTTSTVNPLTLLPTWSQYNVTDQLFQQWWFLRENETGYHSFTRLAFDNGTEGIDLGNVQELRQVVSLAHPNIDSMHEHMACTWCAIAETRLRWIDTVRSPRIPRFGLIWSPTRCSTGICLQRPL